MSVGTLGGNRYAIPPELNWQIISAMGSTFDYLRFAKTPAGANARRLFTEQGLNHFALTSTGSLIGMFVADQLASRPTDITSWSG